MTHFVAGGSTGGTISGTGGFLKQKNPSIQCVLADPEGSIFAEYFMSQKVRSSSSWPVCTFLVKMTKPEKFLVEGVGKGSIPGCMDFTVIDDVVKVFYKEYDWTAAIGNYY